MHDDADAVAVGAQPGELTAGLVAGCWDAMRGEQRWRSFLT